MNVMIINFCHRDFPINYGQTLLGYALYREIEKLGHTPISVSYTERNKDVKKWYFIRYFTPDKRTFASKSFAKTTDFINKNMSFVPCFTYGDVYEIADICNAWVVGGDVIWRKAYLGEIFTLDFGPSDRRRISYAPSIYGWSEGDENFYWKEFQNIENRFDYVSLREEMAIRQYEKLTGGNKPFHAIDPIFLLSEAEWCNIAKPFHGAQKDFILIYIFGNVLEYKEIISTIFKRHCNKQIIIIPTSEEWANMYRVENAIGVEEFVWLFSNASLVITNSFHGVAFSIEFQKEFYTCARENMQGEGKDFRIDELCNCLGILNRNYLDGASMQNDYAVVNQKIEKWRKESIDYLKRSLS